MLMVETQLTVTAINKRSSLNQIDYPKSPLLSFSIYQPLAGLFLDDLLENFSNKKGLEIERSFSSLLKHKEPISLSLHSFFHLVELRVDNS